MNLDSEHYRKYAAARAKKSPLGQDCLRAFLVGGLICAGAEGLSMLYRRLGAGNEEAGTLVSLSLILLAALLTGLGVFDRIARFAGAGTLVPITGFANAITSCAIDARSEGFVVGVGAKIFTIAGPVILYGTAAGTLYGVILWVLTQFFPRLAG